MDTNSRIDPVHLINSRPLGRFQISVILLCTISMILDGYDVQIMGYVAPSLIAEWGLSKSALTPVFSAGVTGMLAGSLISGLASDRYGRRIVLICAMLWVSVCMLATPYTSSLTQLIVIRFITGIGMGTIVPNAVALGGEYSPAKRRATLMMTITCGYLVGALLCGLVAAALVPYLGWRAVFFAGGGASLLVSAIMLRHLPESLQILALRPALRHEALRRVRQLAPEINVPDYAEFVREDQSGRKASIAELFRRPYIAGTLLLWSAYFLNLLAVFFLASWLPVLLKDTGHTAQQAILSGATLWGSGIAGTLLLGWAIDRNGFGPVLAATYLLATIGIVSTGVFIHHLPMALAAIAVSGFCVMGAQAALNAFAATLYPTRIRATGVGWGLGMGRLGSIIGPIVGGEIIHLGWTNSALFVVAAIPTCVAMCVAFRMRRQDGDAVSEPRVAQVSS